jgi:hypothetical protein
MRIFNTHHIAINELVYCHHHLFLGRKNKCNVSQRRYLSKKCIRVSRTISEIAMFLRHYIPASCKTIVGFLKLPTFLFDIQPKFD